MQQDLDLMALPLAVGILGVNGIGAESDNAEACNGKDIPWLQETAAEPVWTPWGVTYRDVIILDGDNVVIGVYNLTDHDLNVQANYDELKAMLAAAAGGK